MTDDRPANPTPPDPKGLAARLAGGEPVSDEEFDALLPAAVERMSYVCWTPVDLVREVVRLIAATPQTRLLDIGSGPGKLCSIAALIAPGHYTGVELKPELHRLAVDTAAGLGASRAEFVLGDALDVDWSPFNTLYLYNPFQEFLAQHWVAAAGFSVSSSVDWARCARATHMRLHQMRVGTRVVTYHGYGLDLPAGYELATVSQLGGGQLALWRKSH